MRHLCTLFHLFVAMLIWSYLATLRSRYWCSSPMLRTWRARSTTGSNSVVFMHVIFRISHLCQGLRWVGKGTRLWPIIASYPGGGGGGGGGGGAYSSSSRAGRLGRTLWPQNSTSVAETERGGQNSTMTPPTLEKGGQYSTSVWKVCKKGGQKSTILKNIGVKILQVWKWGSKFYMLKNRGQNSTMLEKRGVNILHPTPKVEVKILHRLKKGGQKGRAYPLPKI